MDNDSYLFTQKMNSQILLIPKPPGTGMKIKIFVAYLVKEFLRENAFNFDRAIIMDLFDSLFQEDPFNSRFPNHKLHLVHENIKNKNNVGTKKFCDMTIPGFKFDKITGEMQTINAGYCGGPVNLVIGYFAQILTLLTFLSGDDQGATNILYVTKGFKAKGIPVLEDDYNGKVRHLFFYKPAEPFPYVSGHLNKRVRAAVLHLYYMGDYNFILSVVKTCPRISKNMKNYLTSKRTKNIEVYEKDLENTEKY